MDEKKQIVENKRLALIDCQERMWKVFCKLAFKIEGPPYDDFLEYLELREKSYDLISKMDV